MANKFSCLAQPNNQVERTGGDSPARGQACARKYSDLEGCPVKVPPAAHLDRCPGLVCLGRQRLVGQRFFVHPQGERPGREPFDFRGD